MTLLGKELNRMEQTKQGNQTTVLHLLSIMHDRAKVVGLIKSLCIIEVFFIEVVFFS